MDESVTVTINPDQISQFIENLPLAELGGLIGFFLGLMMFIFVVSLVFTAIFIWAWWRIFDKAGWDGAMSLLFLIPGVNIALFFVFAFSDWPALEEGSKDS